MKVVCNERTEMEGQRVGDALLLPVSAGGAYTGAIPNLGTARNNHESGDNFLYLTILHLLRILTHIVSGFRYVGDFSRGFPRITIIAYLRNQKSVATNDVF